MKLICKEIIENGKCRYFGLSESDYRTFCPHAKEHIKNDDCFNSHNIIYCVCIPIPLEYKMRKAIEKREE